MPSDDEFGGFLDRESVLAGGVPARRAKTVLYLIENRTAGLMEQSRQATQRFLSPEAAEDRELAFLEAFATGAEPPLRPTIRDLERYAAQWKSLVPENPRLQAAVAHSFGEKYRFTRASAPGIRAALGLDDAAVQQAFERLYRRPLEGVFATGATPGERLRWAWTGLAKRLENLPPFWTVYSLTITETIGVTILALPIALAGIGPLAGVTVLAVLGLVNVLTIVYLAEAVARNGNIRYGSGFIGKVVDDYLGRAGSVVLSVGIFILCFLVLQVFYVGFSSALEGTTRVPAAIWVALLFLVGLYFLRRPSLDATVASALVVGAVNVTLVVILSVLSFSFVRPGLLLRVDVPFLNGEPLNPEILGLVFGVILTAFFGHLSLSTCARVVLHRDPSGRSLVRGAAAAQVTAIFLYCLFVLGVNGSIGPRVLEGQTGTALDPLATEIGPLVYVLGSVFVVLGMGMGSIQYTVVLFNLVRERLPTVTRPILVLPRRQGTLLLHERRRTFAGDPGLRLGLVYLGLAGDKARFRLDAETNGTVRRVEAAVSERWQILGKDGDAAVLERLPELRESRDRLALEVVDAGQKSARVRVVSSMRLKYEGARDTAGVSMADVFSLPDSQAGLIGWMTRQGRVSPAEAATFLDGDETSARALLDGLADRGFVGKRAGSGGETFYEVRLATRRGRQGSTELWQALGEERAAPSGTAAAPPARDSGASRLFRGVVSSRYGGFLLAVSPVVAAFVMSEWLLLTGSGSFTGLLSIIGVLIVPLLGGIFPVLMLVASRRKGERVPEAVYRSLSNPVLLVGIYVLFLASIFLHGLLIWSDPLQRGLALLVGVLVLGMTFAMRRSFARRLVVELREEDGLTHFAVTEAGHPATADVRLDYPDGEQRSRATFQPQGNTTGQLKVWAHKVTPEGDSEGMDGLLRVRQGDEVRQFDLKLSKGQVVLPVDAGDLRVDVSTTEADDTPSG